jgi:hypothetical protein
LKKQNVDKTHIIVYMDETYCHQRHSSNFTWSNPNSEQKNHVRVGSGKGLRFIILHAITEDGLLSVRGDEKNRKFTVNGVLFCSCNNEFELYSFRVALCRLRDSTLGDKVSEASPLMRLFNRIGGIKHRYININTPSHFNAATHLRINASTHQRTNASTQAHQCTTNMSMDNTIIVNSTHFHQRITQNQLISTLLRQRVNTSADQHAVTLNMSPPPRTHTDVSHCNFWENLIFFRLLRPRDSSRQRLEFSFIGQIRTHKLEYFQEQKGVVVNF